VTRNEAGGPTLVERDEELARLDAVLAAARSGIGAVLLIEGAPGIGKTSLLAGARQRAAGSGMHVLRAGGTQLERDYAMGLVRQALEPLARGEGDREDLFAGAARLARGVVLDLDDGPEAPPGGVLHGLYWLVANLAERVPVLLAIDDAHCADEPSLRFLAYLARRVESLAVALVIATRVRQGADAAAEVLAEIRAAPSTEVIELRPLGLAGVEAVLHFSAEGEVAHDFARACQDATGGNPFLLSELLRELRAKRVLFTSANAARIGGFAPPTVASRVRATLARLGPAARALARAVAVLGDDAELDLAAELADVPMPETAALVGELARAGVLDDALPLRFVHPLLSAAVRSDISAAEGAAAHARAAELLRTRGAGPERVALQLMHTSPASDEQVVSELRLAAERAQARGAPATAVTLLRRGLSEPPSASTRGELLLELGQAEYAVGQGHEAVVHLEDAHRCAVDARTRGRALIALMQAGPGDLESQQALAALIAARLPELEDQDRELALRLRAAKLVLSARTPGAMAAAASEGAGLRGATPGEAVLLGHLTFVQTNAGATAEQVADIAERAARQADALLEEGATSLVITGIVLGLRWSDRLEEAERLLDRALSIARRRGSTTDFSLALTHRASVYRRAGRLREAEADARSALAAAPGFSWVGPAGITPLLGSLIDQGRFEEAAEELVAVHPEEEILDAPSMTPFLLERMKLRAGRGDYRRALADWEEALRRAERLRGISPAWIEDLVVVADIHHAVGNPEAARSVVDQALALAQRWGTTGSIGQALHAAARFDDSQDAVEVLYEAIGNLRRSPVRLELARALVSLGEVLRRRGRRVDSREPLREGYERARQCSASGLAERARAELRASGIRLRREALSGADSLTVSERRIAEMAANGTSNAEIAQALFLTIKTVEMHLTHAYRKLDITGRSQLADALTAKS